jgi:predicted Zn-dependent protease
VVILKEGVVAGLFVDPRTARAQGLQPTGHSIGDEVRPSNLVVRPGSRTRNAIGMDLREYVVLDNLHRSDAVDIATGRVQSPCDVLVYRDHQAEGGLLGVPLSLPVRDILSRIVEIAADHGRYGAVDACTLVLQGLFLGV